MKQIPLLSYHLFYKWGKLGTESLGKFAKIQSRKEVELGSESCHRTSERLHSASGSRSSQAKHCKRLGCKSGSGIISGYRSGFFFFFGFFQITHLLMWVWQIQHAWLRCERHSEVLSTQKYWIKMESVIESLL